MKSISSLSNPKTVLAAVWLALFLYPALQAQTWQEAGLDSFRVDPRGTVTLGAEAGYGAALRSGEQPPFPRRFWIKGDVQLLSEPVVTDAFFLFGTKNDSMDIVYAAGYSLQRQAILFGRADLSDSSAAALEVLARKPVEIIDPRRRYVFKFIFDHQTHELIAEVNGVPMRTPLPLESRALNCFGYMICDGTVRFQALEMGGE